MCSRAARALAAALLVLTLGQPARGSVSDDASLYARPGKLVSVGGRELNMYCMGSGTPTVVLDAGLGDWAPAWIATQRAVATFTRVCAYDRAGYGFSGPGPFPRTHLRIARELHAMLASGGIEHPYVLAGHSFGGTDVQLFADLYPKEVVGLLLVDAIPAGTGRSLPGSSLDAYPREMGRCADGARRQTLEANHKLFARCFTDAFEDATPSQLRLERSSVALRASFLKLAKQPKQYLAIGSESQSESRASVAAGEQQQQRGLYPLGDLPIIVLTSTRTIFAHELLGFGLSPRDAQLFASAYIKLEDGLPLLSSKSRRVIAKRSGHYIQADEPNLVISSIRAPELVKRFGTGSWRKIVCAHAAALSSVG